MEYAEQNEPDTVIKIALGGILQSFYNGIEKIFDIIAKGEDGHVPTGNSSHSELLIQMANDTEKRKAIITPATYQTLKDYAGFRHVFRHSYSFQLNWERMKPLVHNINQTWEEVKKEILNFIESKDQD